MKNFIYYFSGTGNSLSVAKKIASNIDETEIQSIAALSGTPDKIRTSAERIGIICPVYDSGIPVIVGEFLKRLQVDDSKYLYAIVTAGGSGGAALRMINSILSENNSKSLNAGFFIKMPGNFPPISVPPSGDKINTILRAADKEIEIAGNIILNKENKKIGLYPISSLLKILIYNGFAKNVHYADEKFSISDLCTSCGICASVCPTGNITLERDKPVYHHKCELCCACLNFCPVEAIDLSMFFGTKGRGRYHHPDISIREMIEQQGII